MEENPGEDIDETKVDIAARFLRNSNVMETDKENQVSFLKNKGLNASEINLAFQRAAEVKKSEAVDDNNSWSMFDYLKGVVLGAGILSAANYAYKAYVLPYATRELKDDARMEVLVEQFQDMKDDIKQHTYELTGTLKSMQQLMVDNQNTLTTINDTLVNGGNAGGDVSASTAELKSEIAMIKSMMLSKEQFRATPYTAVKSKVNEIPAWQKIADEMAKDVVKAECEENTGNDGVCDVAGSTDGNVVACEAVGEAVGDGEEGIGGDVKHTAPVIETDTDLQSYTVADTPSPSAVSPIATLTSELNGVLYEVVANNEPAVVEDVVPRQQQQQQQQQQHADRDAPDHGDTSVNNVACDESTISLDDTGATQ